MVEQTVDKPTPRAKRAAQPRWGAPSQEDQHRMRREALFRTAAQAFNETGYYNTTLDEVAKRLNVTKPTLYYYVKDKDDILAECNRLAFEHMKEALAEADSGTRPGIEKLTLFLTRYADLMASDFGACLIRTGLQPLRPESRERLRPLAVQLDKALRRIIAKGVQDRSIRECDPKMVTNALFGGFSGIANWYRADGELGPSEIAASYLDLFVHGLKPADHKPAKKQPPSKKKSNA